MRPMEELFSALSRSRFRSSFKLGVKESAYLNAKGIETIEAEACDFVTKRLAPANPKNDGNQTPMKNHPAFIAQHATATCCRKCLEKWHRIPKGRSLTERETEYVVSVILRWLRNYPANEIN